MSSNVPMKVAHEMEQEMEGHEEEADTQCESAGPSEHEMESEKTPRSILKSFRWGNQTLYDHIKTIIELLVVFRPKNTIDFFDQFSRAIRDPKGIVRPHDRLGFAVRFMRMASAIDAGVAGDGAEEEAAAEEDFMQERKAIVSCLDMADYFEEMDVGLSRAELYQIDLALRELGKHDGVVSVRFWGKIMGLSRAYIVAECILSIEEIEYRRSHERQQDMEEGEEEESQLEAPPVFGFGGLNDFEEQEEIMYKKLYKYSMPPLPRPPKPKTKKMTPEPTGEGANKKVYYVCHEPGEDWIPLPNVAPEEIVIARKLHTYMNGYLSANVVSFPTFPGLERELLRAQIARITAGTQVSPIGFYQFGNPDEMDEMAGEDETMALVVNIDYEPVPYQDLLSPGFWVHHTPHILRIGRVTYPDEPMRVMEEMEEEDEKEKEKKIEIKEEDAEKKKKELGPPLLTPLSEDISMDDLKPWTIWQTSRLIPGSGVVALRSNLWPGAYAFCKGGKWDNLYIGNGTKLKNFGYTPGRPPRPLSEYPLGDDIKEATDPTPEEEAEWKNARKPPTPPVFVGEDEEGEELPLYSEDEEED